jgi:hypothetical protein
MLWLYGVICGAIGFCLGLWYARRLNVKDMDHWVEIGRKSVTGEKE